jgi:hypothetical protein
MRPKCEYLSSKGKPCGAEGTHYAHIPVGPGSQTETMIVCDDHAKKLRREKVVTWKLRRVIVPGTWTRVPELPSCDLCSMLGTYLVPARYDGATVHGPWAYMCEDHFRSDGVGLGTGRGQRLLLPDEKAPKE